jgi:serpin B
VRSAMGRVLRGSKLALLGLLGVIGCEGSSDKAPPGGGARPMPDSVLLGSVSKRDLHPAVDGRDLTALVAGNTAFALEMFATLSADALDQNFALGPYSISQAMAMLYAGARGVTAEEMQSALHFDVDVEHFHPTFNGLDLELLSRDGDITLRIANQVWAQTGFDPLPEFLDVLTRDYGAPLAVLDFGADPEQARGTINDWVERATEDKIPELFPSGTIQGNTKLVLTNAIYLDAPWKYTFDAALTRPSPFRLPNGSQAMVDMMHFDDFLPSAAGSDWQAVELPYRGDEVSMIAVVPENLPAFEVALTPARLWEIVDAIHDGGIHLSFPRFTFSSHASLKEAFRALGARSLFDGADLSGIGGGGLFVSAIEHEAYVQVDEEGTKAAAATGVAVADSHGPTVSFDRPFMFFIIDRPTKSVLFLGRVTDPRAG